jgi:hypothetical protein
MIQATKQPNQFNWEKLTLGKLFCIASALATRHKAGEGTLAYDCYKEITNYLYQNDKENYDYIVKICDLK